MNRDFERFGGMSAGTGDALDDYISPQAIKNDRETLEAGTKAAYEYAQRMVAHRTPIDKFDIKISDINAAVDALEPILKKYYCLLIAASLSQAEAVVQYDWTEPFTLAWEPRDKQDEEHE